jgi:protein-glutamine gamma-glutamyltransferase
MRFGIIHRLSTDALAALGLLSLVTSGELDFWVCIAIGSALFLAMLVPETLQGSAALRHLGVVTSLGLLVLQTTRVFLGHDSLTVAVEFAAGLQLIRLATRRGAAHDQQIILLALLHLVAGTVLGGGLAYGLCFLGFLVVAPAALVLSHLRREVEGNYRQGARDRTGLPVDVPRILRSRRVISGRFLAATCCLSIPIFVFTALLFVLFPRVGLSLLLVNHARSERMVGFSDRVDLGKVGRLRSDPTIAARIHPATLPDEPPTRIALYLRGTAFDTYNGTTWSRDKTLVPAPHIGNRVFTREGQSELGPSLMVIDLEPIQPPVVFLPGDVTAFEVLSAEDRSSKRAPRITQGREDDFQYQSPEERGIRYRVYGGTERTPSPLPPEERKRYLTLPPNITQRTHDLAREWAGSATSDREIAENIERNLRTSYRYDLESPSGATENPLEHFLFESKRGHCEYYSTSMAMLLRIEGVPSRNVTGFAGGTFNRFGRFYAVRLGDAHSWVEAYLDGVGWRRFDPTPAGESAPRSETSGMLAMMRDMLEAASERWDRHVVGYDLEQQVAFLRSVKKRLGKADEASSVTRVSGRWLLVAGLLAASGWLLWKLRRKPSPTGEAPKPEFRAEALRVVALYRDLEKEMKLWGVPRSPHTPPLTHANLLRGRQHPIAEEVLALTLVYQEVRFGQQPFHTGDDARFRLRLGALRKQRAA